MKTLLDSYLLKERVMTEKGELATYCLLTSLPPSEKQAMEKKALHILGLSDTSPVEVLWLAEYIINKVYNKRQNVNRGYSSMKLKKHEERKVVNFSNLA